MMSKSRPLFFKPFTTFLTALLTLGTWVPARFCQAQACCPDGNSIITTVAGTGTAGYSGDGGPATSAQLNWPQDVMLDPNGNLFICDALNNVIRKVTPSGIITTFAGNGTPGFSGDGGPATSAQLSYPTYIAEDATGNFYVCDLWNDRVRKVNTSGIISTFAGNGTTGFSGDGGPATAASLGGPYGVVVDAAGNVYIADRGFAIRKVSTLGIITTIAGGGSNGYSGDGGPATLALLNGPEAIAMDPSGNFYFYDDGNNYVRKIDTSGIITSFFNPGGDTEGFVFCGGNLYFSGLSTNQIQELTSCGIRVVAGTGNGVESGDGGAASNAALAGPCGMFLDSQGNLYVADGEGNTVRKIAPDCSPTPTPSCTQPPVPTPTHTPTATLTRTPSPTPSSTPSPTPTNSFTPAPTFTPTCVTHAWPNPFNPATAFNNSLKFSCLPQGAVVSIYTLSGEWVADATETNGLAQWKALNQAQSPAASGIYYYVIRQGTIVLGRDKFLLVR